MVTLLLDLNILDFLHDSVFLLLNGTVSLSCSSARRQCKPDRCFIVTILFFMLTSCYFLSMPVFFMPSISYHFFFFVGLSSLWPSLGPLDSPSLRLRSHHTTYLFLLTGRLLLLPIPVSWSLSVRVY